MYARNLLKGRHGQQSGADTGCQRETDSSKTRELYGAKSKRMLEVARNQQPHQLHSYTRNNLAESDGAHIKARHPNQKETRRTKPPKAKPNWSNHYTTHTPQTSIGQGARIPARWSAVANQCPGLPKPSSTGIASCGPATPAVTCRKTRSWLCLNPCTVWTPWR